MVALRRPLTLIMFLAAAAFPGSLSAQAHATARDSAIARLRAGQQIRITTEGMGRQIGRAGETSGDSLDLAHDDAVRRVPIPAIDTLWIRGGASTEGAIVGASLGALFGVLAVAAFQGMDDTGGSDDGSVGQYMAGAFLVAFVAGGVGALVGGAIPKWKRRFP